MKSSSSRVPRRSTECSLRRCPRAALVVFFFTCPVGLSSARAGYGSAETELVITEFKTRGTDDKGAISWEIEGAKATIIGGKARIRLVKVVFSPTDRGKQTWMTSPYCAFDRETRIVSSDAPLHVRNAGFVLDGLGYDILTDRQKLFIRKKVRMRIRTPEKAIRSLTKLTPARGPGKQPPPSDKKDARP